MDREAAERHGLPAATLVERAALGAWKALKETWGSPRGRRVILFCGKGNNGADGLALSRRLRAAGAFPRVVLPVSPSDLGVEAARQWALAKKEKVSSTVWTEGVSFPGAEEELRKAWLVVDALLGIGLTRPPEGRFRDAVRLINRSGKPVLALDLPTGIDSDQGRVLGEAVRANRTVTFALPKPCFFTPLGAEYSGAWSVADLSLPRVLLDDSRITRDTLDLADVGRLLPTYGVTTHKGTRGRLLLVAGSTGLTGAATLAALSAQRFGAGLVTVACPRSVNAILEIKLTEPMTAPMPENRDGTLSAQALRPILALASRSDAVVLGPGLGRNPKTRPLVEGLVRRCPVPMVVDADALFLAGTKKTAFQASAAPRVVTPHPGEAAGMLKTAVSGVESSRSAVAEQIAREYNVTTVLKGPWTLVADRNKGLRVNTTGSRALATGGTGDVLSGMIGSLLAQRVAPWEAASAAVFLHGLAGTRAEKRFGPDGVLAGDLLEDLPRILRTARAAAGGSGGV